MTEESCLFCRIVAGEIPADVVLETEEILAFTDIAPQAPVHVLVIPKEHIASLEGGRGGHGSLLGALLLGARDVARAEGVAQGGYRTVINTGRDGGQEVQHLHIHVLGGRHLTWPPG